MAKKKAATKKKATSSKKPMTKRASAARSGTGTAKKAAVKKTPVIKTPAKKKVAAKKPAVKKPVVKKKAAAKKTAPSKKKAPSKKAVSKKKTTKSAASRASRAAQDGVLGARYRATSAKSIAAGRAAAAKLAAAAGLAMVKSASNGDRPEQNYERLTKSPFNKRELRQFHEILIAKRTQIVGDVTSMETEALTGGGSGSLSHLPQHMADQGSDTYDQTLALDLAASQRGLLKEIDAALDRITKNTFGICEMLGKPISTERLDETPWARFCIEAARRRERMPYQP